MSQPHPSIVFIDGRAGSGKTTLATELAALFEGRAGVGRAEVDRAGVANEAQVIHMDDLTPGWRGLAQASRVLEMLLTTATWQRYDWHAGELAETQQIDFTRPLIVEGCGSITRATLARASARAGSRVLSVWLDCDETLRKQRALDRDGETFAQFWDVWAEQELVHLATERPDQLADIVCDGEQDKLAECSQSLFSSPVLEATSEQFSKR